MSAPAAAAIPERNAEYTGGHCGRGAPPPIAAKEGTEETAKALSSTMERMDFFMIRLLEAH